MSDPIDKATEELYTELLSIPLYDFETRKNAIMDTLTKVHNDAIEPYENWEV